MEDGILDLLPGRRDARSPAQALMEWDPIVAIYESRLWRRNPALVALMGISFEREAALILDAALLAGDERVLDLACGPGPYARRLARALRSGSVIGLDLSRPMLRAAARKARAEGLSNLTLVHGDAMDLPLADASVDVVNCCGALHLFPEVDRVLAEIHRVLRSGGRFTAAALRRREGRLARRLADLRRRMDGLHAFATTELAARLERAGMSDVRVLHAAGIWQVVSARRDAPAAHA